MFDASTTSDRERKQLLRAILTEVVVTVDRESAQPVADLWVVWDGGAVTEHSVPLQRTGSHTRCTDQDTIALVRQLAKRYPDKQIAAILARQGRRTGAGNAFTAHRVAGLRAHHKIPAAPVRPTAHDGAMVTIANAASELGVSTATVHRWLREGFISGEQITPGAPWQIPLTDELRDRVCEHAPDGLAAARRRRRRRSASSVRPCCTRSNAASWPPYTSTAASEKACESRSNPTRLDCSRTTSERRSSARPTPRS